MKVIVINKKNLLGMHVFIYRVTMVVQRLHLLTLFLKFHNLIQLLCHFCPICSCPSKIGRRRKNRSKANKT